MPKILNERLCQIMEERKATRSKIEAATGVTMQIVTKMRTEPDYDPKASLLAAVADYLQVPMSWLLGRDEGVRVVEKEKIVRRKFFNEKWEEG